MPYKSIGPRADVDANHAELVKELVEEMQLGDKGTGPVIVEQPVKTRLHVYVLWHKWDGVREEHRSAAILDAYKEHFGEEKMRSVSIAMGLTGSEAKSLGIDPFE